MVLQFAPGNPSEVLVTSADSQIRVLDGVTMVQKFRGVDQMPKKISHYYHHRTDDQQCLCTNNNKVTRTRAARSQLPTPPTGGTLCARARTRTSTSGGPPVWRRPQRPWASA
jgi:WD repeat-containing protein 44